MDSAKEAVESVILDPAYHDVLAIVKAIRNGIVYGTKVRFPHALVMVCLFKTGSVKAKALMIFKATRQHARNLALFATIYKSVILLLRHVVTRSPKPPTTSPRPAYPLEKKHHPFLAGVVAGYFVFGTRHAAASSVNQQIVTYVFARVCLGLAKLLVTPPHPNPNTLQAGYGEVRRGGAGALDGVLGLVPGMRGGGDSAVLRREGVKRRVVKDSWSVFAAVSWGMVMWLFRWHPDVLQPSLRSSMRYLYDNAEVWDGFRNLIWHNL